MTATERRQEIGQTIVQAMKKVNVDWSRENESTVSAQAEMEEQIAKYAEGTASKADVKDAYKKWVTAHKGGLF